ncbi:hypothetical protein D0U04_25230 [Bacillus clarus]|uniref:Uncharacterized protein n=1 Tax=Bacillus clarus TaxID=2338372 RepID=A0A090YAP9_9BACI|nr:hypothetical protein [Bacillus clarus]KFM95261.1 hypothetical protein DJ93_5787 [Bacillus clarus]RFT63418.1 hypothetical protein D0U04_25230 [Bacillus clarus]
MKKFVRLVGALALTLMVGSPMSALAESHHGGEAENMTPKQIAKQAITNYDAQKLQKAPQKAEDGRFINEMIVNQERVMTELEKKVETAKENQEKFYSMDEILKANAQEFGISEDDMNRIKRSIATQKEELSQLLEGFTSLGEVNHEIAIKLKENLDQKWPKSVIYVDHSKDKQDGIISGGGFPYCLDDNGWGPWDFISSDCYKAILINFICASDSTIGKMDSNMRYCKAYVKNCSPLIGHSSYWHTH